MEAGVSKLMDRLRTVEDGRTACFQCADLLHVVGERFHWRTALYLLFIVMSTPTSSGGGCETLRLSTTVSLLTSLHSAKLKTFWCTVTCRSATQHSRVVPNLDVNHYKEDKSKIH